MRAAAAELDKTRFEYLEEKLRARDAQLAALRRDRNALLSSLRQLQQQQQQQQVVAEVVAEPPTPTPPPQAEPPATPTPIPTPTVDAVDAVDAAVARTPEAAAAFVSPIARLPRAILKEVAPPGSARTGGGDAARPRAAVSAGLLDELQALSSELLSPLGGVA